MTRQIVILGAGTAGTIMANRIARTYRRDIRAGRIALTIVDEDGPHLYQPGLLFLPFGRYRPEQLVKTKKPLLPRDARYVRGGIERVDPDASTVHLESGTTIGYDVLLVATGSHIAPEETEGLTGPGWREKVFDFYTLEGATALRDALAKFPGGRLVVNVVEMPIKCPVAPLEFAFLADDFFTRRGIRDRVEITYVTPLDGAFTKATCSHALAYLLEQKRVHLVTEFAAGRVDGAGGKLYAWDDTEVPFDLLVTIPAHKGADFIGRSAGLGDEMNFVLTDPHTLQARRAPNIFAIGDATNVPASKAGSVAHFEAEELIENLTRFLDGRPLEPSFDGHANCFIETGHDRALLIDFNYELEPVHGRFPFAWGPVPLLRESRLNHLGKLFFRWIYWN
ncbi:MAG: NAD(P)/FAD-dependent oxidoreductase, partial [Gemmatimonadota bacterium]|nr:NAD(P)/FAD-dependent oxidoreductase [Gemmatimonadota bacterium]